jgi:hypothetical protein
VKFRATSYAMGSIVAVAHFEAPTYSAARRHPKVAELPAAGSSDRGKVKVIGIKPLR